MNIYKCKILTPRIPTNLEHSGIKAATTAALSSDDPLKKVGAAVGRRHDDTYSSNTNRFAHGHIKDWYESGAVDREFLRKNIVHAELGAIENWRYKCPSIAPEVIFITHNPCLTCTNYALFVGIRKFYIGPGQTTQGNADADMVEEIIKVSGGEIIRWQ